MKDIKFSYTAPGGDRKHYVFEEDVRVVLSRLPEEVYGRLRVVHFNDIGWRDCFHRLHHETRAQRSSSLRFATAC